MPRYLLLPALFVCLALPLAAQNPQNDSIVGWSLDFGVGSNFTISSLTGSAISLSWNLSESEKIRGGLSIDFEGKDSETDDFRAFNDSAFSDYKYDNSGNKHYLSLEIQYLKYLSMNGNIFPYYTVGPFISFSSDERNNDVTIVNQDTLIFSDGINKSSTISTGIYTGIGVEWKVGKQISLFGEYRHSLNYSWIKSESKQKQIPQKADRTTDENSWRLRSMGVLFGAKLYF